MFPGDIFDNTPPSNEPVNRKDVEMWTQARVELQAFAKFLEGKGISVTAAQMRLAIKLSDALVAQRELE